MFDYFVQLFFFEKPWKRMCAFIFLGFPIVYLLSLITSSLFWLNIQLGPDPFSLAWGSILVCLGILTGIMYLIAFAGTICGIFYNIYSMVSHEYILSK